MATGSFVHLHCHTHYSLLDGANRIPELVAHTKGLGMTALAMTDHGNLYGAIEFYRECRTADLNPVVGYEAYVAPTTRFDRDARKRGEAGFHLTLLAQNRTGFKNLLKLASSAFLEGYYYVPRIDKELLAAHSEGLICLSGCASAEFSEHILAGRLDEAEKLAEWFATVFGKNFYVEVQNNGLQIQKICAEGAIDIARKKGLPLVATSDAHYLTRADAPAHDVLLCINTGAKRGDAKRMRYGDDNGRLSDQFYIRSPQEMYALFPDLADAVQRSQEIADGVHLDLDFKARHFPVFTPPDRKTPEDYLRQLCEQGLRERFKDNPPQAARDRLAHELGVICRMGFASYFLIVSDFVRFAVEKGIPCSARGSGCGALVSYVLKLSHVDPLAYDLLFERFLDPNRAEAPDIDIDFCQIRREEVIAYVKQKYGEESVAQIATFGTLAARAAIKDVGRVLDVPLERVNQLTALIPTTLHITIDESLEQVPDLKQAYDNDPVVRDLIDIARKLEGTNRNTGTHAAGVVISNGPLSDYVPLQKAVRKGEDGSKKSGESVVTTQWVMGDLEKVGLLKMDFLGLRTLSLVEECLALIEKNRGQKINIFELPLDDRATYQLLQRGDAKGVFQFESDGIRELLKRLKPDNIRDIIACTALYRPGPLQGGMVDAYINRKHGREQPDYPHPVMEEILEETFGVQVYQEQVMRILNKLGGIELSSAYACIKAISKKKLEIIDQRRGEFVAGAQERGLTREKAEEIFGLIVEFGSYGFNKCLAGSTTVINADTGDRATLEDLHRRRRAFAVHALGDDWRLGRRQVIDVIANGRKPVFALRTAQGKRVVATDNHPFLTLDGWTLLRDLRVGDFVATPRQLSVPSTESWPEHELIALAGLLSEGNLCHPSSLYFYGNDETLVDDFVQAATRFPDSVARIYRRPQRRCLEVCVNTGRSGGSRRGRAATEGGLAVARRSGRCGAFQWAEGLGIVGHKATQKFVPEGVFRLCDADLELFLGRLWSGDGFIANAAQFTPFYATSSARLATDVQTLLLRLGIVSGVHAKNFKYRGATRPGYTVHLLGEDSARRFLARVCKHTVGREVAVAQLGTYLNAVAEGQSSKDIIPLPVRTWVDEERRRAGLTWDELERQSGVCTKDFVGVGPPRKRGFRRGTLAKLAAFFASTRLGRLAASDVFWDRVVAIEPAGEADTYDLTVEGDHNFVADGLVVHNSHSAAYALVSYQTAYLKQHYTPEFMAALLSSEIDDGNKRDIMVDHIADAKRMGVEVLPPCVNASEPAFSVVGAKVVIGLLAIKGLGHAAAGEIVRARHEGGPFKDLYDFCERIDVKSVPRAAIEKLIKAGALDRLGGHRAQFLHALPRALQAATERQQDARLGQGNLFEAVAENGTASGTGAEPLPEVPAWPEADKLKYEKEALDFYFSSHPLAQVEKQLQRLASHSVKQVATAQAGHEITIGGMLSQVRFMNTQKARNGNTRYLRCKIEDLTGILECVMWPSDFARNKEPVQDDRIVFFRGARDERSTGSEPIFLISQIIGLEQMQRETCGEVWLRLKLGQHEPSVIDALASILKRHPGTTPVMISVVDGGGRRVALRLGRNFSINPLTFSPSEVEDLLGSESVKLVTVSGPRNGR